ncbi:MAG TPA: hypothetical protein VJ385_14405 [Fibrobacteria bacterium]|nr:hypothetical protein [Fibrobacteria bacterium]
MKTKQLLFAFAILMGTLQSSFGGYWLSFGLDQSTRYVDFSTVSPFSNHQKFPTWKRGTHNAGTQKYFDLLLNGKSPGTCFTVYASPESQPETNTDLIAYADTTMIDDDGRWGSLLPSFKVWTTRDQHIRISAYNDDNNDRDFGLTISEQPASSLGSCKNNLGGDPTTPLYNGVTGVLEVGPSPN